MKRLLIAGWAVFLCFYPCTSRSEITDRIVAIVNDDIVTLKEVEKYVAVERTSHYATMNEYTGNLQLREKLDMFIESLLITQQAKKYKIDVSDKDVDSTIATIRKQNLISDADLRSQLKRENVDYKDFWDGIKRGIIRNRVLTKAVLEDLSTADKNLKAYYDAHAAAFTQDEYRLEHIFVSGQKKNAGDIIQTAFNQLEKGRPFADVTREFSDDALGGPEGDTTFVKQDDLVPELRQAVKLLIPGSYSNVLRTPYGFHILMLVEVKKGQILPFEDVKDQVREGLVREESERKWKEFMTKLRSSSYIEVKI